MKTMGKAGAEPAFLLPRVAVYRFKVNTGCRLERASIMQRCHGFTEVQAKALTALVRRDTILPL
jgi:hypothetical protein